MQNYGALYIAGHLPIKCQVEKVSMNEPSAQPSDQTQQAFLNLADRITSSMVEQGDRATEILNAVERLHGIIFLRVYKGSVVIEVSAIVSENHRLQTFNSCAK